MQYREKHQIEFSECDENAHLKLPSMVDLMMQVSEHQLEEGNAGTKDLLAKGMGWVVTQYHFEIKNLPGPTDNVVLTTEASGYNKFFEYRDFGIEDENGNELVSVKSQWVLFDIKNRKMLPADEEMMKSFNVPLLKKMPRFPRLRPQDEYQTKRQYRVRYDDLDTNHHLTNSHYFNWFIDMLGRDFLKSHLVSEIDIKFDQELHYGEVPYSCLTLVEKDDLTTSYHVIVDEDNNERTVCELKWRKI
ncbi:acyl-[acyl-carrier-protein] thioesterase [Lactobacillus agrestimuris]|uniref:acyl-[acyl-carrier-protein] thioesterase n=1 Tax=Lactobacillus agrestimuris TaxID=2941328 RepID=UPI0019AF0FAD|nr:acyl-ACP thioesterase domain-containing protein [Lactobacillus agrestimuris]MBD5431125.1 acyl-[acyl-carrier-protein] thioesterase [Lactobacillus sp.]